MKKYISYILASIIAMPFFAACTSELDQTPKIETTSETVYENAANYKSVLAKLYASYVIAGQEKGGANVDITSNNGYDYLRGYFNLQECSTDETASTWLEGDQVTGLTYMTWDANDPWVADVYYRIYYTVALCNEFLRHASDGEIAKFSDSEQAEIKVYRSEARFLRALAYSHALDLFNGVPFVTENDPVGAFIPPAYTRTQLFEYLVSELKDIETSLLAPSQTEYGRASQAAAWTLLAKIYLNAETYTGTKYYTECITYCDKVISAGFSLESDYAKLFNADNDKRTNEIIFILAVDSQRTVSWGATTYIVCGEIGNSSSQDATAYGATSGWGMFRVRGELPDKFAAGDKRAMFYTSGQTQYFTTAIDDQSNGYFSEKWTNLTDAGTAASNTDSDGVNTDFPVFRLADVYLMYAEAVVRGGSGGSTSNAVDYVNLVRRRAYGNNSGDIAASNLTLNFLIDERARELYHECTRRTDLIRFGLFTGSSYIWQYKGGVLDGMTTNEKYNVYPIPAVELSANPNLKNDNY